MLVKSILLLALMLLVELCSLQVKAVVISVQAENEVIIQPSSNVETVSSLAILSCSIQPSNASFSSRWITPGGQIITGSIDQYSLIQGLVTSQGMGTVLAVESLSYENAGAYTCEVVERGGSVLSCDCDGFPTSATVKLILQVYVHAFVEEVVVTVGTTAFLHCEMSGYIHPDEDLLWYKDQMVIHNRDRFFISYSNGTAGSAQNGGLKTVASRVSMLEISSSVLADAGEYVCRVRNKDVSAVVRLSVEEDTTTIQTTGEPIDSTVFQDVQTTTRSLTERPPLFTTDPETTAAATILLNECQVQQSRIVAITVWVTFIATMLVSVLLTVLVVCLWLKLWQRKQMNKMTSLDSVSEEVRTIGVTPAVNVRGCVLDGLSLERKI